MTERQNSEYVEAHPAVPPGGVAPGRPGQDTDGPALPYPAPDAGAADADQGQRWHEEDSLDDSSLGAHRARPSEDSTTVMPSLPPAPRPGADAPPPRWGEPVAPQPQWGAPSQPPPRRAYPGGPSRSEQPAPLSRGGAQDSEFWPEGHTAPPPPRPAPVTERWDDDAGPGWDTSGYRGGAAPSNFNYVDAIRQSELVPTRKIPPGRGWRKAIYAITFGLINLGRSPDERRQAELDAKIRSVLRGRYKIGVLGKGGTGKTTIAACVGSVFAELRPEDRVVAIDADTAFGKLGSRVDPTAAGSYWELAADQHLDSFSDVRSRVGSNSVGLFVLAGEAATARRRVLDPSIYREATARLDNHFTISIIDCGSTMDSPVTQEVLADLDALIVVSSPWVDGASAAGQTLEWLANSGYTALLHRTVLVLNDTDGHADDRTRARLVEQFASRGQVVVQVPFDAQLRPAGVVDIDNEVNRVTRRRIFEIAAALAEHFAATTDRPRERR